MINWIEMLHPLQMACYMLLFTVFMAAGISIFLNYATILEEKDKQANTGLIKGKSNSSPTYTVV